MERVVSEHKEVAGLPVQWDDQPTNGITYVNMMYDLSKVGIVSMVMPEKGAGGLFQMECEHVNACLIKCVTYSFPRLAAYSEELRTNCVPTEFPSQVWSRIPILATR